MFNMEYWQQAISQFHFIRPEWLLLFIPFAAIIYQRWCRQDNAEWQHKLPPHLQKVLIVDNAGWKKQLPLKLLSLILFLTILVASGPSWQREPSPFGEDKSPLLIVLDSSYSMLEKDVAPSRLVRAKQKINDLLELREGGKTGLIVYAGSAHLAMPLTQDNAVFAPYLAAISPDVMPKDGKAAYKVMPIIKQQFANEDSPGTVLLITDGVMGSDYRDFEEYFQSTPQQLLILAVGDEDATSDFPVNIDSLKDMAERTGGKITMLSIDGNDVAWLVSNINAHMLMSKHSAMPWQDFGYYLLFPITLLMLLWFRKGWMVQWCTVLIISGFLSLSSPTSYAQTEVVNTAVMKQEDKGLFDSLNQYWLDLWLTKDQQGQWYFNRSQFLTAAQHYQDPLRKGIAFYYASEFELAYEAFSQVESETMMFNAANALIHQREYVAARALLKQFLVQYPDNSSAKHNLLLVQQRIDEINQFSESQANTEEFQMAKNLPENKPKIAEGADEQVIESRDAKEQLSAENILADKEIANKWLQRVEADPKQFLQVKFQMQTQTQKDKR